MGRHRKDPTLKTFSLMPDAFSRWQEIMTEKGIKLSARIDELISKDIQEDNRNKATTPIINRSPISYINNAHSDSNNSEVTDDERIEAIKAALRTKLQPIIDSRNLKALHDILPVLSRYTELINQLTKPAVLNKHIISKLNKLEQQRLEQTEAARQYREKHEREVVSDDDKNAELGLSELMKVAESDSRKSRIRARGDNNKHRNRNRGEDNELPSDEDGIVTETDD